MHRRSQCQVTGPGATSSSHGGRPPVSGQPAVRRCGGPARTGGDGQAAAREPRARGPRLGGGLLRAARAPEAAPAPPLRRRAAVAAGRRLGRPSLGGLLPAAQLRLLHSPKENRKGLPNVQISSALKLPLKMGRLVFVAYCQKSFSYEPSSTLCLPKTRAGGSGSAPAGRARRPRRARARRRPRTAPPPTRPRRRRRRSGRRLWPQGPRQGPARRPQRRARARSATAPWPRCRRRRAAPRAGPPAAAAPRAPAPAAPCAASATCRPGRRSRPRRCRRMGLQSGLGSGSSDPGQQGAAVRRCAGQQRRPG